jgi:Protein of unknown function (DUF3828)
MPKDPQCTGATACQIDLDRLKRIEPPHCMNSAIVKRTQGTLLMQDTKLAITEPFWKMLAKLPTRIFACALFVAFAATCFMPSSHAEQTGGATADAPDVVAKDFYGWYLKELSKDRDPLTDSAAAMKAYVSGKTLQKIRRMIKSPQGMEADYLIQAQDYMDEWLQPPKSQTKKISNTMAELIITLGEHTESKYQLSVVMLKEDGRWKISKVNALTH